MQVAREGCKEDRRRIEKMRIRMRRGRVGGEDAGRRERMEGGGRYYRIERLRVRKRRGRMGGEDANRRGKMMGGQR